MFSPGRGACEGAAAKLAGVEALAGSGLLTAGATGFAAAVGTATPGVETGLAGVVAAGETAVAGVMLAGFVTGAAAAVAVGVESEATGVSGAGAGAGRGTTGAGGFEELDEEAGCIPTNARTRSICG